MQFLEDFSRWINELKRERPQLIIVGDYNIAHEEVEIFTTRKPIATPPHFYRKNGPGSINGWRAALRMLSVTKILTVDTAGGVTGPGTRQQQGLVH